MYTGTAFNCIRDNFIFIFTRTNKCACARTDTFGVSTMCPYKRGVYLIDRQLNGVKKGMDQL